MLTPLKYILYNKEDAFARALATAEDEIARRGGTWFGEGAKGSFLLLHGGVFSNPAQGAPYRRAGHELLAAALRAPKDEGDLEAHLLHFLAGCGYAGAGDGSYEQAIAQFAYSAMGTAGLDPWCGDWCRILLASAAMDAGDSAASAEHFGVVAERDKARAAKLFEHWTARKI